ncbi:hypothetical protein VTP01DRAFT_8390 [Rhizomucor pusillus]|uniref:uncharacterized protein n=1 Tax=Rhizomucor pusillus TaxID=4840 RepID=UPI0037446D0A
MTFSLGISKHGLQGVVYASFPSNAERRDFYSQAGEWRLLSFLEWKKAEGIEIQGKEMEHANYRKCLQRKSGEKAAEAVRRFTREKKSERVQNFWLLEESKAQVVKNWIRIDLESVCTVTVRPRVSLYDYLVGAGALTYAEPEDAVRWIVGDADLTGAFQSYLDRVVSAAREYRVLSMAQRLALNFILLVTNSPRFTGNVETEILEIALKAVRKEQGLELVEDTDVLCQRLNQAARCSRDDAKEILAQWERDGNDSVSSRRYRDVYRELLKAYSDGYDTSQVNEDTYVKDTLVPILRTYFENSSLITTAGVIRGSRVRRQAVEPLSEGRKADFSVHSCDEDDSQVLLLVECKPPSTAGSDDLTTSMNEAIKAGADDLHVQVCGIVCHGHRCDVFAMDLQYHGMYRMKHLNTFFIPVDHTNFDVLLGVFQVMDTLQASA